MTYRESRRLAESLYNGGWLRYHDDDRSQLRNLARFIQRNVRDNPVVVAAQKWRESFLDDAKWNSRDLYRDRLIMAVDDLRKTSSNGENNGRSKNGPPST